MKRKRLLSILTAALVLLPSLPTEQGAQGLIRSVTASAATEIKSGVNSGISYQVSSNVTLYFYVDLENHNCEVGGSKITGSHADVEIPETITYNGVKLTVTAVRANAFKNQTNLGRISVKGSPKQIVSIGDRAFYGCSNLTDVDLTWGGGYSAVEYIGASAFKDCSSLNDIIFAGMTDEIGPHAFWNCTSIMDIYLNDVKTIGTAAFYNCTKAASIHLDRSQLTTIPEFTFWHCTSAKTVSLPESLTEIEKQAFDSCTGIETVFIPDAVTTLGTGAFLSCTALRNVLMPESIISVGDHAFFNCPNMKFFVCKNPNAFIDRYAAGWHLLENGMPVKNDNFVVWSSGSGRVKNYADNNGLNYHNVSDAAGIASERYRDYEWRQSNSSASIWGSNGKYYFNSEHKQYANKYLNRSYNGVCYGMAVVSALTSSGRLAIYDYAPQQNSKIKDISTIPNFTKSYVTTIFANQLDTNSGDYSTDNGFSKEMLRYAEYITYGADAAVLSFRPIQCAGKEGHATVCFGLEFKEYASDKTSSVWNGWDARMLVYNVNGWTSNPDRMPSHSKSDYVYINFSSGKWFSAGLKSSGYECSTSDLVMYHTLDAMIPRINGMTSEEFLNTIKMH